MLGGQISYIRYRTKNLKFEVERVSTVSSIISLNIHLDQHDSFGDVSQKDVVGVKTAKSSWNRQHFTIEILLE